MWLAGYTDKRQCARLLRTLKRLYTSKISLEVFINSGIGCAVPVLMDYAKHPIMVAAGILRRPH